MKRVGIFAGSFDPIHDGHIAFAKQALEKCRLEKVFFLVEPRPRRKQGVRALEHRINMAQLAIKDEPRFGNIVLDQARFTVTETMPILKNRFKGAKLNLLLGDDMLSHLAHWPHIQELILGVIFIIGVRSGDLANATKRLEALENTRGLKLSYKLFISKAPSITSSQIRLCLKRGQDTSNLPEKVRGYIKANSLYINPRHDII